MKNKTMVKGHVGDLSTVHRDVELLLAVDGQAGGIPRFLVILLLSTRYSPHAVCEQMGHSMGGLIVISYLLDSQDRSADLAGLIVSGIARLAA